MSYEKQTWVNGDVITDDKLNHMEDGIANAGGGGLLITATYDSGTNKTVMDKTWKEIKDAMNAGIPCTVYEDNGETEQNWYPVGMLSDNNGTYSVKVDTYIYYATTPDDYPEHSWND